MPRARAVSRPRSERKPDIGPCRNAGKSRIHGNQLCPGIQGRGKRLTLVAVRIADDQVVAPDHDALGMVFIIHDGVCTAGDDGGGDAGPVTEMAGSKDIRRSEKVGEPVDDRLVFSSRTVTHHNGFGAE